MPKIFFLLFSLVIFTHAQNTLFIEENFEQTTSPEYIYFLEDKEEKHSLESFLHVKNLEQSNRSQLGARKGPFWTKMSIQNNSGQFQNLVLYNPLAGTIEIDVYVYKDGQLIDKHILGSSRKISLRKNIDRRSMFKLKLENKERVSIVSRVYNSYVHNIGWIIQSDNFFYKNETLYMLKAGLYGGFFLFYILYTASLFKSYKTAGYFVLCTYSLSSLVYHSVFNGFLYRLGFENLAGLGWHLSALSLVLINLFPYFFFNTRKNYLKVRIVILGFIFLYITYMAFILVAQNGYTDYFAVNKLYGPVILLNMLYLLLMGTYMIYKKEAGAWYYLVGQGAMLLGITINTLGYFSIITYHEFFKYAIPLGTIADSLFMLLAQNMRLSKQQKELVQNKEVLMEKAHFISMGQAVENIIHQWKTPLTSIGSSIMVLETTRNHQKENLFKVFDNQIVKITNSIELMKHTLDDFSSFYQSKTEKKSFELDKCILNVEQILHSKMLLKNAELSLHVKDSIKLHIQEYIVSNIFMVLLNNSLDAFKQNDDNHIHITLKEDANLYHIVYEDNAGGITIEPIERIFESYISSKGSHGIGLAIAKMLVEERLGGTINVKNTNEGAVFNIALPKIV